MLFDRFDVIEQSKTLFAGELLVSRDVFKVMGVIGEECRVPQFARTNRVKTLLQCPCLGLANELLLEWIQVD